MSSNKREISITKKTIIREKTEGDETKKVKPIKPPFIREVEKYGNLKKKAKREMNENLKV